MILQAFEIVEKNIHLNDYAVRKIIDNMKDKKQELFEGIFKTNSSVLMALFLQFIDKHSANTYLDKIMFIAKSDNTNLRLAAIHALAQTENKKIVPDLISALEADEWEIRAAAAKGLESIPTQKAENSLLRALRDQTWRVRQNAASAALSMSNHEFMIKQTLLSEDPNAIDSLFYAADTKGMSHTFIAIQEGLQEHSIQKSDENGLSTAATTAIA